MKGIILSAERALKSSDPLNVQILWSLANPTQKVTNIAKWQSSERRDLKVNWT